MLQVLKSNREPFLPLYATSPVALLLHVMNSLANEVPIMGAEGQIINISLMWGYSLLWNCFESIHVVTRHDVLSFVQDNLDVIGAKVDESIQTLLQVCDHISLSLFPPNVVISKLMSTVEYVEETTKVVDALKLMIKKGVSEVAVVGPTNGSPLGNI